jgi:hypothetical protein
MRSGLRRSLTAVLIACGAAVAADQVQAQGLLTITAPVSGRTVDGRLSFTGTAALNTITRRGTVHGKTNAGVECRGTVTANLTFSHGAGAIVCGQLSSRFVFRLTSRQPPTGTGTGTLSDGRKVVVKIGQ